MKADLILSNVEFLGAPDKQKIRVAVGESITIRLTETQGQQGGIDWFSDLDQVLDVKVSEGGKEGVVTAKAIGPSRIRFMSGEDEQARVIYRLYFEVFNREAGSLKVPPPVTEPKS